MLVVDLFAVGSFSLTLALSGYFLVDVSFYVEVGVAGVFLAAGFEVEEELLDVEVPLLKIL